MTKKSTGRTSDVRQNRKRSQSVKKTTSPAVHVQKPALDTIKRPKTVRLKSIPETAIGEITHFFPKISVVVVRVDDHPIFIGDMIHVHGQKTDFRQKVDSLQVESKDVRFARQGELVGLKVILPANPGDKVSKFKKK